MGGRVILFPRVYTQGGAAEEKQTATVSTFSVLQRGAAVHVGGGGPHHTPLLKSTRQKGKGHAPKMNIQSAIVKYELFHNTGHPNPNSDTFTPTCRTTFT